MNKKKPQIKMYRLERQKGEMDSVFFIIVLVLLCIGSIMVLSASYYVALNGRVHDSFYFARKQLGYAALSVLGIILVSKYLDYRWLKKLSVIVFGISVIMCLAMKAIPSIAITTNGATRWIRIMGIQFQPSEIMKLGVILVCAKYISAHRSRMNNFFVGIVPLGFLMGASCFILITQPHLSGAIIIALLVISMMFIGGANLIQLGSILGAGVAAAAFILPRFSHAAKRLAVWKDPFAEQYFKNDGWQPAQSLLAISSGGFWGVGLGRSIQKHGYLPEPQNDYIFSIVCEELGFVGAMIILSLFVVLVIRGFKIASKAPDVFSSLVVYGIMIKLALQVALNVLVVTNTVPSTGISLPFFSYGGTSLILQLGEMGIVMAVSRYSYEEK